MKKAMWLLLLAPATLAFGQGKPSAEATAPGEPNPFAESQLAEMARATAPAGAPTYTFRGFADVGYIDISQSGGPKGSGGNLSWAFGNSQFNYSSEISTFTVNEVDLTFEAERERNDLLYGARASVDYYPSRDQSAYQIANSDRPYQVDQAFLYLEWLRFWNTRILMGRAPGFVTLEQQETDAPDSRLIGHTYVFQAGGGYPYGLQAHTWPLAEIALRLGYSNGGVGDYSFYPGDTSTLNRPTARDKSKGSDSDRADGKTTAVALNYTVFDRPAEMGTLNLGAATAHNPALTFNAVKDRTEPYDFTNLFLAYRFGAFELRGESARLNAYYEASLGQFDASMYYVLLSWFAAANHLVTLRDEHIGFVTDLDATQKGKADKVGITYRYRVGDSMVIKVESVTEIQAPQFFLPTQKKELTTRVLSTSWVYSF